MNEAGTTESADEVASAADDGLRFRYRAFLGVIALLASCVLVSLTAHGTPWALAAMSFTGVVVGFGVPWLCWHLQIRFAARVAAPIFQLSGFALRGVDPRDDLWSFAELPVLFFLAGWAIDTCLGPRSRGWSIAGRSLFTLLWLYIAKQTITFSAAGVGIVPDVGGILLGIVAVWLPRGRLLPPRFRLSPGAEQVVDRGMKKAGGWIARRTGIAVLILLPSLIFLDVLALPPLLKSQFETASLPGPDQEKRILFWLREGRALSEEDLAHLEVHAATQEARQAVIDGIRLLRRYPRDPGLVEELRRLSVSRLSTMAHVEACRTVVPVFYLELPTSNDDRATSGLFSVPDSRGSDWQELRPLTESDLQRQETRVRRATLTILASGILILMLLGGSNGGSAAAWWLSIFLAGINMGWVSESLDLTVERVRFVIWRDYANQPAGATMFGLHSLLLFFARASEWLTHYRVAHAGIWVALCWPVKPGRLVRSILDRFWVQAGKVIALACLFYALRYGVFLLGAQSKGATLAWHFLFPVLLIGTGIWWRRTLPGVKLPVVGRMAATAFLLRGWVPWLTASETQWAAHGGGGLWLGYAGIVLTLIATVLLILALERGTFLSPPHVEGQIWLIGIAALPLLETVVGEPVTELIENSGLFLGTTVTWVAFAAGVWLITPISAAVNARLSRWRARGLEQIEATHEVLKSRPFHATQGAWKSPLDECFHLFAELGVCQPQLWRHAGQGNLQHLELAGSQSAPEKFMSARLAERLGEVEGSLRLEEMRTEWRWAAFQPELEHWFITRGDQLLIPACYEGQLVGIFEALDVPENRFLLRPAVSGALGRCLATALLLDAGSANRSGSATTALVPHCA